MNARMSEGKEAKITPDEMRGRKEMKDLDKSALSHGSAPRLKTVLRVGEEKSINTIKYYCIGVGKKKQASFIGICGRTRRRIEEREKLN